MDLQQLGSENDFDTINNGADTVYMKCADRVMGLIPNETPPD